MKSKDRNGIKNLKNKIMEQRFNKIELEYLSKVVQIDMEKLEENMEHDVLEGEEEELKMIQDLYSKLLTRIIILNK